MKPLAASLVALTLSCTGHGSPPAPGEASSPSRPPASPEADPGRRADGGGPSDRTRVVMLGTGTPVADPARSGPAVAVVVDETPYLVDCGPGVVRRAQDAAERGVSGLEVSRLSRAFITHLHSDHTAGYADLILTPWVEGRAVPLEVYGPRGLESMTAHLLKAYEQDIAVRLEGNQPATAEGWKTLAHEVEPGEIYRDRLVTVKAFPVHHGAWKVAFGYRFETVDRTVVISGDTTSTRSVIEACDGCDLLIHEVFAEEGLSKRQPDWQAYHRASHTSSVELGELAREARPGRLVLYHQLLWGATRESVLRDIRERFDGPVSWANDLDVY